MTCRLRWNQYIVSLSINCPLKYCIHIHLAALNAFWFSQASSYVQHFFCLDDVENVRYVHCVLLCCIIYGNTRKYWSHPFMYIVLLHCGMRPTGERILCKEVPYDCLVLLRVTLSVRMPHLEIASWMQCFVGTPKWGKQWLCRGGGAWEHAGEGVGDTEGGRVGWCGLILVVELL